MGKVKKHVILITNIGTSEIDIWDNIKAFCDEITFKYNTLSRKKFPFEYRGYRFDKMEIKGIAYRADRPQQRKE